MNWTEAQAKEYMLRRLKDEARARERMQSMNFERFVKRGIAAQESVDNLVQQTADAARERVSTYTPEQRHKLRNHAKKVAGSGNQHNPIVVLAFFKSCGLPEPFFEYRFYEQRKWRWDLAWPEQKLACEVNGGIFVQGRHNRGTALLDEYEKLSKGAALGWRTLLTTPDQLLTAQFASLVREALAL